MNSTLDLTSYSLEELTDVLRIMKGYRTSLRQIGAKAKLEDPKHPQAPTLSIEYAPGFSMDTVRSFAHATVSRYFPETAIDNTVSFVENKNITGGIRIFYGDDMMDVSFEKFKNVLTNK